MSVQACGELIRVRYLDKFEATSMANFYGITN